MLYSGDILCCKETNIVWCDMQCCKETAKTGCNLSCSITKQPGVVSKPNYWICDFLFFIVIVGCLNTTYWGGVKTKLFVIVVIIVIDIVITHIADRGGVKRFLRLYVLELQATVQRKNTKCFNWDLPFDSIS